MNDLSLFEADASEAQQVLGALEWRLGSVVQDCRIRFTHALQPAEVDALFALQRDAFGGDGVAFDRRGLAEVVADPEAVYLLVYRGSTVVGGLFGYWEWPDETTVRGTDFFLDTVMLAAPLRGRGGGRYLVAAALLLAELLGCQRVGIAAWQGGPCPEALAAFYRRMGFTDVAPDARGDLQMEVVLDERHVDRWWTILDPEAS